MTLPICPHCGQPFPLAPSKRRGANPHELSRREMQILRMLWLGSTNAQIAKAYTVEVGTVKNHVHSILKKLHVRNRVEAASRYFDRDCGGAVGRQGKETE